MASRLTKFEVPYAVYATLLRELDGKIGVYESFSNPDGRFAGGGGQSGEMFTRWGFKHAIIPLMEARTTFDIEWKTFCGVFQSQRINEKHQY